MDGGTKPKRRKQQAPDSPGQIKKTTAFTADMRLIYTRSTPRTWRDDLDDLEENTAVLGTPPIYH